MLQLCDGRTKWGRVRRGKGIGQCIYLGTKQPFYSLLLIRSLTSLWPGLLVGRDGWLVCLSVCHNFLNWRKVALPCSYRSSCYPVCWTVVSLMTVYLSSSENFLTNKAYSKPKRTRIKAFRRLGHYKSVRWTQISLIL